VVTPKEAFRQRLIETRVRFKRLNEEDIQAYIGSGEWRGKAGGYAVQGIADRSWSRCRLLQQHRGLAALRIDDAARAKAFPCASAG